MSKSNNPMTNDKPNPTDEESIKTDIQTAKSGNSASDKMCSDEEIVEAITVAMKKAPYHQAAFINALWEEGERDEILQHLQETWNELCEARKEISELKRSNTTDKEECMSDEGFYSNENGNAIFSNTKYTCPIHGEQDGIGIQITIRGIHNDYCVECWKESLDKAGVQKVTPVEKGDV